MNVLVTALYNYSPRSRMGGRGYDFYTYMAPFMNVLKLNIPTVVYTHELMLNPLREFLTTYNIQHVRIELFDLEQASFANKILELKQQSGLIDERGLRDEVNLLSNDRNHTLCLLKPWFLKNAIQNNWFNGQNYVWIDAGLFHHGLFPDSFGGMEKAIRINLDRFWPESKVTLFRPGLIESLLNKTVDEFIFIKTSNYYSQTSWWHLISPDVHKNGHIVGGLFGGKKETCIEIADIFEKHLVTLLDNDVLTLEEEILSVIYATKYSHLGAFTFDNWYHDIPGDACYYDVSTEAQSFYKIFKT